MMSYKKLFVLQCPSLKWNVNISAVRVHPVCLQLAEVDGNGNMLPFPTGYLHMKFEDSQAVLDDYSDVVLYERGHLNPDQHQSTPHDRAATYTLTNVVPQIREFNIGPWREHEERIRVRLNNFCRGTAFVVTGVTTTGHAIHRNNQRRVGIPEDMWSAYCCTDYDRNAPHDVRTLFPAHAALAKNAKEGNSIHEMTVQELESFLISHINVDKNLQIFYDNCRAPSPLPVYLQHTIWAQQPHLFDPFGLPYLCVCPQENTFKCPN